MLPTTKVLFTACALCTFASGVARAGQDQPTPTAQPTPNTPPDPSQVPPPDTTAPTTAVPDATPPGSTTTTTTTTTTVEPAPVAEPVAVPVMTDTGVTYDDRYSYAWHDELLPSGIGVSTILGGGVAGFTGSTMRSTTADVGGLWDLRVTIGSHVPLALELGYVGTATTLRGLPAGQNGTLVGTAFEGALRYNMLPHFVATPYLFAGIGWQRYDVTSANVTLSDAGMNDKDNLLEFPMGVGMAYRMNGFVFDLRGTFRAATDQNLVLEQPTTSPTSSDFAKMHTWEASAALGYEF